MSARIFKPVFCRRYADDFFYTLQIEWSVKVFSRFPQFRSYLEVIFYGNRKREQIILSRHWNYTGATLQPQFTENLFLVTFTVTFKVFFTFYIFGMVCTLIYRCLRICSNWTQFHTELTFLKKILRKNCYPENVINKCFKHFLNNIHLVKENVPTVGKSCLLLVLPYLEIITLQARTKLQQALKGVLNCCKLEIIFKCQTSLSDSFY